MQFDLNEQDIQLLGQALGDLPFKTSAGLINKLQTQINEQNKPNEDKSVGITEDNPA